MALSTAKAITCSGANVSLNAFDKMRTSFWLDVFECSVAHR